MDHSEIIGHDFQKTLHAGHSDDRCVAFGGILTPRLDVPYEVTFRYRKEVFHAITMMKVCGRCHLIGRNFVNCIVFYECV